MGDLAGGFTFSTASHQWVVIARQYVASGGTLVLGVACQFGWFVILARSLGVVQFGELMLIMAVTTIASALCGVGSGDALLRRSARNARDYNLFLGHGLALIGLTGVGLVTATIVVLELFFAWSPAGGVTTFTLFLFAVTNIVFASVVNLAIQGLLGLHRYSQANLIYFGFSSLRLAAAAVGCLVFGADTLAEWAWWTTFAHLVAILGCVAILWPMGRPVMMIDKTELGLGFQFCTPNLMDAVRNNVDRFMLGIAASAQELGSYAAAMRMTLVSKVVVNSLNRIMYPRFARHRDAGSDRLRKVGIAYALVVVSLAFVTATLVFLLAPFLPALLGESYRSIIFDLRVLCWLTVPTAISSVAYDILGAMDRHHLRAKIYNALSVAGAAGTAAAIYFAGVTGAFAANYAVHTVFAVAMWAVFFHATRAAPHPADGGRTMTRAVVDPASRPVVSGDR